MFAARLMLKIGIGTGGCGADVAVMEEKLPLCAEALEVQITKAISAKKTDAKRRGMWETPLDLGTKESGLSNVTIARNFAVGLQINE
jgi:hypothetical protein